MAEPTFDTAVGTLYAIVVDVNDLEICSRFWTQVLGADILYQDASYIRIGRQGQRPTLLLQKIADKHSRKNRMHIDLDVANLDAAVRRVQALGGRQLKVINEYGMTWAVMSDPDGNEFCLVKHAE